MPTIDLGAPPTPAATGLLDDAPRRITLTLPELLLVANRAGGAPLPFDEATTSGHSSLGGRLGRTPAAADAEARERALAALHDPQASLARRGLLVDTVLDEGLLGAVGLLATPALALDLEVAVGTTQVRAWHRQAAGAVATLATADGIVFELAWFPTDRWAAELARAAILPDDHRTEGSVLPARVDLPYALVDAATEAVRSNRGDLLSVLVAEHTGETCGSDGRTIPDLEVVPLLTALASEPRGRLRALVADVSGDRTTVVGVVSWALLADGWRALRPRRGTSGDRVEVELVEPDGLAAELAPVLAEAAR